MVIKSFATRAAPPIKPPSISGQVKSSAAFFALQLPPYKMETELAISLLYFFSISKRITSLSKGIVTNYALYLIICGALYILIYSVLIYFLQLFFVIMYISVMIFQQKKPE